MVDGREYPCFRVRPTFFCLWRRNWYANTHFYLRLLSYIRILPKSFSALLGISRDSSHIYPNQPLLEDLERLAALVKQLEALEVLPRLLPVLAQQLPHLVSQAQVSARLHSLPPEVRP
jgi:hypothetical protein